jgi:hypothetical protein
MIIGGFLGFYLGWPLLLFSLAGLIWEIASYLRGVLLLSPAVWEMRPGSKFLKQLNRQKMPEDIRYIAVLSDTRDLPHHLVNLFPHQNTPPFTVGLPCVRGAGSNTPLEQVGFWCGNLFLFWEGGDGVVPLSSQKLSPRCVPNFSELDYSELMVGLPHFALPRRAGAAVLQALGS